MRLNWGGIVGIGLLTTLTACEQATTPLKEAETKLQPQLIQHAAVLQEMSTTEPVLIHLDAVAQMAKVVIPECSGSACVDLKIHSLHSQDTWFNDWVSQAQAQVLLQELGLQTSNLSLQQAVNRYAKASQQWSEQHSSHQPYQLQLMTQLGYQKNGYVLLQIRVDRQQADEQVKDRIYFFIADRNTQKTLKLQHILVQNQTKTMDKILHQYYQKWLQSQQSELKLPKKLIWQDAEWFYDTQGIGLHFRSGMLAKQSPQLDIYLTAEQSQRVLKPELYQTLF